MRQSGFLQDGSMKLLSKYKGMGAVAHQDQRQSWKRGIRYVYSGSSTAKTLQENEACVELERAADICHRGLPPGSNRNSRSRDAVTARPRASKPFAMSAGVLGGALRSLASSWIKCTAAIGSRSIWFTKKSSGWITSRW